MAPTLLGMPKYLDTIPVRMHFVTLVKFSRKPTKADQANTDKSFKEQEKMGVKNVALYWTFGRYDAVRVFEAPDVKTAMKVLTMAPEHVHTETLVALPRSEVDQLLG